jgi:hypothetical protein
LERNAKELEKEKNEWKSKYDSIKNDHDSLKENLKKIFNADQILALSRKNMKFVAWLDETVEKAICLRYMLGTTSFEYVRKFVPLPCERTLSSRIEKFKLLPGVCEFSIKFLKENFAPYDPHRRRGVLVFDRMSLIEGEENYQDDYVGYDTLKNDKSKKASEGLVALFAGTIIRFKQIVGFHLTEKSVDGNHFKKFAFDLIFALEQEGTHVDGIVGDMGTEIVALLSKLGISFTDANEKFFIEHPFDSSRKLWILIDSVHEFKKFGCNFRTKNATVSQYFIEKYDLKDGVAKSSEVTKLLNMQKKMIYKPAPKLTNDVVNPPDNFSKMRVKTHTRFFSFDVATSLECLLENDMDDIESFLTLSEDDFYEQTKKNCTAWLINFIRKWINFMKNRFIHDLENDSKVEEIKKFLRECVKFFSEIKMGSNRLLCVIGAKMTTKSMIEMIDFYKQLGISKFCPAFTTQDCLENVFSGVRARKKLPSSKDFIYQLRAQIISRFTNVNVRGSSYEYDDSGVIRHISFLKLLKDSTETDNAPTPIENDEDLIHKMETLDNIYYFDDDFDIDDVSIFFNDMELNAFYFITGHLVGKMLKKFNFEEFKCKLIEQYPIPTYYNRLTRSKNFSGTLHFPTEETFKFFLKLERIYQKISHTIEIAQTDQEFKDDFKIFSLSALSHREIQCENLIEKMIDNFIYFRLWLVKSKRNRHNRSKYSSASMK